MQRGWTISCVKTTQHRYSRHQQFFSTGRADRSIFGAGWRINRFPIWKLRHQGSIESRLYIITMSEEDYEPEYEPELVQVGNDIRLEILAVVRKFVGEGYGK